MLQYCWKANWDWLVNVIGILLQDELDNHWLVKPFQEDKNLRLWKAKEVDVTGACLWNKLKTCNLYMYLVKKCELALIDLRANI